MSVMKTWQWPSVTEVTFRPGTTQGKGGNVEHLAMVFFGSWSALRGRIDDSGYENTYMEDALPGLQGDGWREEMVTHPGSDHLADVRPRGLQDCFDVLTALTGIFGDAALDQIAGAVGGDLPGDEDLAVGLDGLGLYVLCWSMVGESVA